jgi:hypothetical protein
MEQLAVGLAEQGDSMEAALAKDPLAGRHEMIRQGHARLAKQAGSGHHNFSVREWQTVKHTELRWAGGPWGRGDGGVQPYVHVMHSLCARACMHA